MKKKTIYQATEPLTLQKNSNKKVHELVIEFRPKKVQRMKVIMYQIQILLTNRQ